MYSETRMPLLRVYLTSIEREEKDVGQPNDEDQILNTGDDDALPELHASITRPNDGTKGLIKRKIHCLDYTLTKGDPTRTRGLI